MDAVEIVSELTAVTGRGAGTDAERRAATALAARAAAPGRSVRVETFWCRPNRALAQAWHVALALAGSATMTVTAPVGGALCLAALLCVILDALTGVSPGRRLTREHASQNVVSEPVAAPTGLHIILTAAYDAGRCGLVHAAPLRRLGARARHLAAGGRLTPGWLGWLAVAIAWLVAVAIIRRAGGHGLAVALGQAVPSAGLVIALGALLGLGVARFGPAAGDDATGVAVALALAGAAAAPGSAGAAGPHVTLVLQGAGDEDGLGLRHHLRAHRPAKDRPTAVIGIAACGAGRAHWWSSDGPLWALRTHPSLRGAVLTTSRAPATPVLTGHRGRGSGPAFAARLAGVPALTIGCLGSDGTVPHSHRVSDNTDAVDPESMRGLLEAARALIETLHAADPRP